jgi:hypothetical protein
VAHSGAASGFVHALKPQPEGYESLIQEFQAAEYQGRRIRMSAYVRTRDVPASTGTDDGASLWLRIDRLADGRGAVVGFYSTSAARPITGTTDWTRYDIVLDVPVGATGIAYGLVLKGGGQAWVDSFQFEIVGPEVPVSTDLASMERETQAELARMSEATRAAAVASFTQQALSTSKAPARPRNTGFEDRLPE